MQLSISSNQQRRNHSERAAALTDSEVAMLSADIDKLPAGATTGVAGVIGVTVLVVLLVALLVRLFYPPR